MQFSNFIGNAEIVQSLRQMVSENRLPQTLLFAGPRGVGKATLARLLAAAMNCLTSPSEPCGVCSNCRRMLAADLSLDEFQKIAAEREKLTSAQRGDSPLILATHPDFLIFPPDGPLQLITIEQARQLRAAARFGPSEGKRRIFLIDHADRANDEAANSLLKTLEEPAPALTLILTAENPYELLPTIRSRSIPFYFAPLSAAEMERFFQSRPEIPERERPRLRGWAQGSPGRALSLHVEEYLQRREAMLALLRTALGQGSFADLLAHTEAGGRRSQEKLELQAESLTTLLDDLLHLRFGSDEALVNDDIRTELESIASSIPFEWFEKACGRLVELEEFRRRNVQKQLALEALALELRASARAAQRPAARA
jgi:DNA polymerase III subunit delta'